MTTNDFWKIVEDAFIRPRNLTLDQLCFLNTKQLRGKIVEHFYRKLKELAKNLS